MIFIHSYALYVLSTSINEIEDMIVASLEKKPITKDQLANNNSDKEKKEEKQSKPRKKSSCFSVGDNDTNIDDADTNQFKNSLDKINKEKDDSSKDTKKENSEDKSTDEESQSKDNENKKCKESDEEEANDRNRKEIKFVCNDKDENIDEKLQNEIAEKIGLKNLTNAEDLKTKRWGIVIEKKDKDNHIKTIKKMEVAIELLSSHSKTTVHDGTIKTTKTKTMIKTVIAKRQPPFESPENNNKANKKMLMRLAKMLHIGKSVKDTDIEKVAKVDAKIVEISNDGPIKDELEGPEKFDKEFETANGGLHILYTIANNIAFLKKDLKIKSKIDKIKGLLIYEHDGIYRDYWDKLIFAKDNGHYIDETEIFEGIPVDKYEDIPDKGQLSPIGFYQANEIPEEELKKQFKTVKLLIKEIALDKNKNIPELFKDNNKIPILDRLIFSHAYKNSFFENRPNEEYVKVCICDDSFCIHPCDQIRWVKKNNLE